MVHGTEYDGMVHGTEYDGAEYLGEVELQWIVGVSLTSPRGTWY